MNSEALFCDGRLSSFTTAVTDNTRHMMDMLAQHNRKGEMARLVSGLSVEDFAKTLELSVPLNYAALNRWYDTISSQPSMAA